VIALDLHQWISAKEETMISEMRCVVCDAESLEEIAEFAQLFRVTSDCKPWPAGGRLHCCKSCGAVQKIADEIWLDEIKRIYDQYEIYHLSAGAEQVIFGENVAPRSRTLVDFVVSKGQLPKRGSLIDVGCGNGAALTNFSRALPNWRLWGSELSDKALDRLSQLPNFECLYTVDIADIQGEFDVITMIHALEHMATPFNTLVASRHHLTENGLLFIEVPDLETSPFDILVADHRSHFTRATLRHLAARADMNVLELTNKLLPKEITFLARRARAETDTRRDPTAGQQLVKDTVDWLLAVQRAAERASTRGQFGIFGSSIAGMSLYARVRDRVAFFVDEDRTRIGQVFEGRPILSPNEAPAGSTVYVPLAPPIAQKVVARLSNLPAHFVPPPDLRA
jgi:2-polyprenyl-3-methyl-5-hydroxy-6-metoxy-1,4-benzoquinol methylase